MRIALIDNSRGWGGAEELLYALSKGLRERGHYPGLFLREGSATVEKFIQGGFDVCQIPRGGLGMVSGIMKMASLVRKGKFDLIHVHRNHDLLVGKIAGLFAGKLPLMLTQHCWLGKTSRPVINLPDRIVAVSQFIADGITERFPALRDKVRIVHNGINLADFVDPRADYWTGKPELAGKSPLLGVVGYFYKNQEELIELLPRMKRVFPDITLVIIGSDDGRKHLLEKKAMEMGVTDSVFFAGTVPHDDMKHALAGLDLNVSAYRREGLGLSVIEGMAVGTPFVGYRIGGYTDIVENGVNGCLADNRDEFVDMLFDVLSNKQKLNYLKANAKSSVSQRFLIDTMLDRYLSNYEDVLKEKESS